MITGVIRKILLLYNPANAYLYGIVFFAVDGSIIYESANKWPFTNSMYKQHEILL
jgi:hypothetical protein